MTDVPEISHEVVKLAERSRRAVVACFMGGHSVSKGVEILKREKIPVYPDPYRAVNSIRRGVWSVQSSSEEKRERE